MSTSVALAPAAAVIAVDVGKSTAAVLVTDVARRRLLGPVGFPMTGSGVSRVIGQARAVLPDGVCRVGVEAPGIITGRFCLGRCGRVGRWWS